MNVYYNEFDPKAAAWLRELMKDKLIPEGEVDERPIQQVEPRDVRDFDQCHFFAGIGGWPYALDLSGWGDRSVWTGSCPCQPFSNAGKRKGQADERHLWPMFFRLIRECNPPTVFGEQVASDDGYRWLARIRDDLEEASYAVGCADLPACCAGAPHIRQRLFWVADAARTGHSRGIAGDKGCEEGSTGRRGILFPSNDSTTFGLADSNGRESRDGGLQRGREHGLQPQDGGTDGMVYTEHRRPSEQKQRTKPWGASVPIACSDGKARRIEPGIFPLADGIPGRVGLLRGAGNAIVSQVAAIFIKAYLEAKEEIT